MLKRFGRVQIFLAKLGPMPHYSTSTQIILINYAASNWDFSRALLGKTTKIKYRGNW